MASITVRNLRDETHRALRIRAATHGLSTEAEVRRILDESVESEDRVKLGSLLASIARKAGAGDDLEIERDKTANDPLDFK